MTCVAHNSLFDPVRARSPAFCRLVGYTMRRYMRRSFHAVRVSKPGVAKLPPGRPAIIYTNHPSWWDPALFIVLGTGAFADRPGYGPMDAAALDRYRFMRRIGLFGIEAGTRRGAAQFLRTSLRILKNPDAMLWVTAEGAFTDPRERPVRLQPGVAHLASRVGNAVIVPLAIEYPFWNERYPEALCRFGEALHAKANRATVEDWQVLLEAQLTATMETLAAQARTRDFNLFEPVIQGAAGIGGIYDSWHRLSALVHGECFRPEHDDPER
ncbi:MAG TPA: lysophospholipid acyltransferase family protein [Gammaproteobacteria bacterium]|nr:lysophospholipid acyltransferase family protein [Gammaproteobacteria bacterium]